MSMNNKAFMKVAIMTNLRHAKLTNQPKALVAKNNEFAARMLLENTEMLTESKAGQMITKKILSNIDKDLKNIETVITAQKAKGKSTSTMESRAKNLRELKDRVIKRGQGEATIGQVMLLIISYVKNLLLVATGIMAVLGIVGIAAYAAKFGLDDLENKVATVAQLGKSIVKGEANKAGAQMAIRAVTTSGSGAQMGPMIATGLKVFAIAVIISITVAMLTKLALSYYAGKIKKEEMKKMAQTTVEKSAGKVKGQIKGLK